MGLFDKIKAIFNKPDVPQTSLPEQTPLPKKVPPAQNKPQALLTLEEKVAAYKRKTWMPQVEEDTAEQPTASKIGGAPYLAPGERHPLCQNCGQPLTLFLQLNPASLPQNCDLDLHPDQLIQLFYCTNQHPHCEVECEAWQPFAKSELARSIPLPALADAVPQGPVAAGQFPQRLIIDWVENEDYPDWQEMQKGAAGLSEQEVEQLENSEAIAPKAADKLGGWPYWVQGVEYPKCPECNIQMQMIFQLDSSHHLPYTFGDAGIAHLHQCRLHKNVLAFGWASY